MEDITVDGTVAVVVIIKDTIVVHTKGTDAMGNTTTVANDGGSDVTLYQYFPIN